MEPILYWLIWFVIAIIVLAGAYWILKNLIMPVVPAGAQPFVWAIIGVVLLILLLYFFTSGHAVFGPVGWARH